MFRVVSNQFLYRIVLFLALGLMAGFAVAQDQPKDEPQDPKATDKSESEKPAAKQAPDAVDPP